MTLLPQSRPLTRADLDRMPEDGHRYELIDGVLVVSPAPRHLHQRAVGSLFVLLHAACPPDLEVLLAPFDVALADDTVLQPDLLAARRSDVTSRDLPTAPLLAVEVSSPSTRLFDLSVKKARFELAGTASYWVVDPDAPSITVWELGDHGYAEIARATGGEAITVTRPFQVTLTPDDLIA